MGTGHAETRVSSSRTCTVNFLLTQLPNFSHSLHSHKSTHVQCSHSQLHYDGYEAAASSLSGVVSSFPPTALSSRLSHLVQLGLKTEGEGRNMQWNFLHC